MLVLRLADWWHPCTAPCPPESHCHHRRVEVTDIYIFRNKVFFSSRWFLDIEKSVLLELKGVKIIRSYRDLFQLIRDFYQLIYSGFFDWELMWFCIIQVAWLISLVFVMYLVALFWHSNDVFIRAHMETIEKFKKCMFRIMNMSLSLILRWKLCYLELESISTMRCGIYEDAMKEYGLGPNYKIHTFERVENEIIQTKAVPFIGSYCTALCHGCQ